MSQSTHAIICNNTLDSGGWSFEAVQVRQPQAGELLVRMVGSGLCHGDVLAGNIPVGQSPESVYPRVLGHEGSGYVESVGPGTSIAKPGDAVILSFMSCQNCLVCTAKLDSNCPEYYSLNFTQSSPVFCSNGSNKADIVGKFFGQSSFAGLSIVDQRSVVNVSSLVRTKQELLLFSSLGCGLQTGSGAVMNAAKAGPEDVLLINGIGAAGLAGVMAAKIANCKQIICVDKIQARLDIAKTIGATHIINGDDFSNDQEMIQAIYDLTNGVGPTITIEATGAPPYLKMFLDITRRGGKYVQVGSLPLSFTSEMSWMDFMMSGKQIIGSIQGHVSPREHIPKMIQWYRDGVFPLEKIVKVFQPEKFADVVESIYDGTAPKPVFDWSSSTAA